MDNNSLINFKKLFYPNNIALVGISRREHSLGRIFLENLINFGYSKTSIFIVNPKAGTILGIKCYQSLNEIEEQIDMLVLFVKRDLVYDLISQSVNKKICSALIITSGFREIDQEGYNLEIKIKEKADEINMRIVGPNSMGIVNSDINLNATFSPTPIHSGNFAFISQSGALGAVTMEYTHKYGLGFSKFVSLGNKLDINFYNLLLFLGDDDSTKIIMAYLESFSEIQQLYEITPSIAMIKPIIIVKSGRTTRGAKAAISHTGALTSNDSFASIALERMGIIRADTIQEMVEIGSTMKYLSDKLLNGLKTAVISNAGGPGTLMTDALIREGFTVDDLSQNTNNLLENILPFEASTQNPIDVLPSSGAEGYTKSLNILLNDDSVNLIFLVFLPPVLIPITEMFDKISPIIKNSMKPIIITFMGVNDISYLELIKYDFHIFKYPEVAVKVVKKIYNYFRWKNNHYSLINKINTDRQKKALTLLSKNIDKNQVLGINELSELLQFYNLKIVESNKCNSYEELILRAKEITYPVVLKIESEKFTHKSDVQGVILNIKSDSELFNAFNKLDLIYENAKVGKDLRFYTIQKYISESLEIYVGSKVDPQFGSFILFGSGGVLVEILNDIQIELCPLNRQLIEDDLQKTKLWKLLGGFRGKRKYNIEKLIDFIIDFSRLVAENQNIIEIDINPLILTNESSDPLILDVRAIISNN